ncbi:MAG: hypothetical protein KKC75_02020 [Nanoarchaeota archaeon]|nr:hypothetical protein [Nanoarchaeota archaeon]MBU1005039.1 hypothetical protein [Nanoarchaeota archaeon]MBU1946456.1 hypothetical protein [Nanoarchaeota archaeon]
MPKKKIIKKYKNTSKKSPKNKKEVKEIKMDISTLKQCPQCGSDNFFYSKMRDELVCRDCGGIFSKLTPEQMQKYKHLIY